jgi:chromosome segregation ATPase
VRQVEDLRQAVAGLHGDLEKVRADLHQAHAGWAQTGEVLREVEAARHAAEGGWRDSEARLNATQIRLCETEARLGTAEARRHETEARLGQVRAQLEAELESTRQALRAEQAQLDPFRDFGPFTLRVGRLLHNTSARHPRLAAVLKGVLRGARSLKRGLAAPWKKRAS